MKRRLHLILVLCFIAISCAALSACKKQVLEKPKNIEIDLIGTYSIPGPLVTWGVVEMSTGGYHVEVNGELFEIPYRIEYKIRYELDSKGNQILDENDRPIPILDNDGNTVLEVDSNGRPVPVVDEKGNQIPVRNNYLVLGQLEPDQEYKIRVMAVTTDRNYYRNGPWSDYYTYSPPSGLNLKYNKIDNGAAWEVAGIGTSNESEIIIPDKHFADGSPITTIAEGAFANVRTIKKVSLGANIKTIGNKAFQNSTIEAVEFDQSSKLESVGENAFFRATKLADIQLPDTVERLGKNAFGSTDLLKSFVVGDKITVIEEGLFSSSGIEEITLSKNITEIKQEAFYNCKKLEKIQIPNAVKTIGRRAFANCSVLQSAKIGSGAEEIGMEAFYRCISLTQLELGQSLTTISSSAFQNCELLENVSIPSSVQYIGLYAFRETKLWKNAVAAASQSTQKWQIIYADKWAVGFADSRPYKLDEHGSLVTDSNKRPIPLDQNNQPSKLNLVLESGTVGISSAAFYATLGLITIDVPDVVYINDNAFLDCYELTDITNWNNVVTIGNSAFANAKKLTLGEYEDIENKGLLKIGNKVKSIGEFAFAYTGVVKVEGMQQVERVGNRAFFDSQLWKNATNMVVAENWIVGKRVLSEETATITANIIGVADYVFYQFENLKTFNVPAVNNFKYVGKGAFRESAIASVNLRDVISIGEEAFLECEELTSVTIGSQLEIVENYTFYGCKSLTSVTISSTKLHTIGNFAFYQCEKLGSFDFKEGIKTIGEYAFVNARFTSVNIAASIETIGDHAFRLCTDMVTMNFAPQSRLISIGDHALRDTWALLNINLPEGLKHIGVHAFRDAWALREITLPNSLESISDELFRDCVHLEKINLGNGIKSIGEYAFLNCEVLLLIEIPASVKKIGAHAFRNCVSLISAKFEGNVDTVGSHAFNNNNYLTILSKTAITQSGWALNWNSSFRPVVFGANLNQQEGYIESVVKTNANMQYVNNDTFFYREGYAFVGFSNIQNGSIVDIDKQADGTNLFAKWLQLDKKEYVFFGESKITIDDYIVFWNYGFSPADQNDSINYTRQIFVGWYDSIDFSGEPIAFPYYATNDQPTVFYAKWEEAKPDGTSPHTGLEILADGEERKVEFSRKHIYHFTDVSYYASWFYIVPTQDGTYKINVTGGLTIAVWTTGSGSITIANSPGEATVTLQAGKKYIIGVVDESGNMPAPNADIYITVAQE